MRNGKDAVCFTAGVEGAAFSAGVIHAYLAADREPPKVVAGISMGALSASAMQKAYGDFRSQTSAGVDTEAARWTWYRRYLVALSGRPLDVLWDAIPDPSDFFAEMPPVKDGAVPAGLEDDQEKARRSRYLLVLLGRWLAGLAIPVRHVFDIVVHYVRWREGYPEPARFRRLAPDGRRFFAFVLSALRTVARLVVAVAFAGFFPERLFSERRARPLFGWSLFIVSWLTLAAPLVSIAVLALAVLGAPPASGFWWTVLFLLAVALSVSLVSLRPVRPRARALLHGLLAECGFGRGLVNDFHLRRKLMSLFDVDENSLVGDSPMPLLIVAAPLPTLMRKTGPSAGKPLVARQVWAGSEVKLVDALRAALALPVILEPFCTETSEDEETAKGWLGPDVERPKADRLDLVDGSVIRQNPIPALFRFLKANPRLAEELRGTGLEDPAVHVVYSVPAGAVFHNAEGTYPETQANIVDVARLSSRLARRRDTQVEVAQTNFMSLLECVADGNRPPGSERPDRIWPVFADEIAPEKDLGFDNPLNPQRSEVLARTALGCRATLERLYATEIDGLAESVASRGREVSCASLLQRVATGRLAAITGGRCPGVSEVCETCPRTLRGKGVGKEPPAIDPVPKLMTERGQPEKIVKSLSREKPRIVLVTSGGVFRGSFHIGLAGALLATKVKPDLIVGASVGSLVGAAIGRMFDRAGDGVETLEKLVALFLEVDKKVALTRTLKTAAREIGVRGRSVGLSPARLRRLIREGSRADAGFAAVGAPPALIDAISDVLMIPHRETSRIAADFVAGHVTDAVLGLMHQLKRETVRRLDVQDAIMGASLLENVFHDLIKAPSPGSATALSARQPFADAGIAFFCTTTDLGTESTVILGDDTPHAGKPWSFLECCLASSAFPAVFSPRRGSDLFPGSGLFSKRYADGGMFDNLPFLPAIRILSHFQAPRCVELFGTSRAALHARWERPDLILVGALDVNPEEAPDREGPFDSIPAIGSRAATLRNNVKIRSFEAEAEIVHRQIERVLAPPGPDSGQDSFLDTVVDAAVLPVFPMDKHHLNATFAFCRSTGLREKTVLMSIANGCFETLRALAGAKGLAGTALEGLRHVGRIPTIRLRAGSSVEPGQCPYYATAKDPNAKEETPLACPFAGRAHGLKVFDQCREDKGHRRAVLIAPSSSRA